MYAQDTLSPTTISPCPLESPSPQPPPARDVPALTNSNVQRVSVLEDSDGQRRGRAGACAKKVLPRRVSDAPTNSFLQ